MISRALLLTLALISPALSVNPIVWRDDDMVYFGDGFFDPPIQEIPLFREKIEPTPTMMSSSAVSTSASQEWTFNYTVTSSSTFIPESTSSSLSRYSISTSGAVSVTSISLAPTSDTSVSTSIISSAASVQSSTSTSLPTIVPLTDIWYDYIRLNYDGLATFNTTLDGILAPRLAVIILAEVMGGWTVTNRKDRTVIAYVPCVADVPYANVQIKVNGIIREFTQDEYLFPLDEETCRLKITGSGSVDYNSSSWTLGKMYIKKYYPGALGNGSL